MIRVALSLALLSAFMLLGFASGTRSEASPGTPDAISFAPLSSLMCGATIQRTIPAGTSTEGKSYPTKAEAIAAGQDPDSSNELYAKVLEEFFKNTVCAPCSQPGCEKSIGDDPTNTTPAEYGCWVEKNPDGTWTLYCKYLEDRNVVCICTPCPPAPVPPAPLPGGG